MMVKRLILLLLWLGATLPLAGQSTEAERRTFEKTKASAERGDVEAQLSLGSLYATGTGVAKDAQKAAKWHRQAAEQGLARAQYQLSLDYFNGSGVKPDKAEAVRWLQRAADQGLVEAQLDLGLCYSNGEGLAENATEAIRWFRKTAAQGFAYGEYELGKCYLEGSGVPKDTAEGVRWTRQAAERGFALAQHSLGLCYEKGDGVAKDLVQAYKWFALAAAQDDEHAAEIRLDLAKVESSLSKEQIVDAQRLAREFKPGPPPAPASPFPTSLAGQTNVPPAAATGVVNVKADDELCEIFVDEAFVGNSPATLKLSEGPHVVTVRKPGFNEYRREIRVGAGSSLTLRVVLEKQP